MNQEQAGLRFLRFPAPDRSAPAALPQLSCLGHPGFAVEVGLGIMEEVGSAEIEAAVPWVGGGAAVNRAELQRLAKERMIDARVLLAARHWSAAYYLAGYAVECALKACIARLMKSEEFPDRNFAEKCWTHNLPQLFSLAGLKADFDAAAQTDPDLLDNWDVVKDWNESSRYARLTKAKAEELYEAITNKKHGVLSWIKLRW
jgi:HEPN domain-containing protein